MSEHEPLEPLDAELAAMLAREGSRLDAPSGDVEARLWGKLSGAIGGDGGGGDGGSDGSDPSAGGGAGAGAGAGAAGGLLSKAAPYLATLIAGGAIGAIVHAQVQPPRVVYVDRPVASAAVTTNGSPVASVVPSSSVATVSIDALPSVIAPGTASAPKISASGESDEAFVAERRLLDAARTALASGDAQTTLARVEEHVRSYPKGRFQEEREALRVRALADAGRRDEAKAAAKRFEARWPGSVLLPAVKAAAE